MRLAKCFLLLALGVQAQAAVDPALAADIESRVLNSRNALAVERPLTMDEDQMWIFRLFWLRVRPHVGWSLPGLVNLQVIPDFEFIWVRDLPEGWSIYKPSARPTPRSGETSSYFP